MEGLAVGAGGCRRAFRRAGRGLSFRIPIASIVETDDHAFESSPYRSASPFVADLIGPVPSERDHDAALFGRGEVTRFVIRGIDGLEAFSHGCEIFEEAMSGGGVEGGILIPEQTDLSASGSDEEYRFLAGFLAGERDRVDRGSPTAPAAERMLASECRGAASGIGNFDFHDATPLSADIGVIGERQGYAVLQMLPSGPHKIGEEFRTDISAAQSHS